MVTINGKTKALGILGNPTSHSFSPIIHNAAFEYMNLNYIYIPLPVEIHKIGEGVEALRTFKFLGSNVTTPFKEKVIPYLDEVSELSQKLGAVNTIIHKEGKLTGTTTDGYGFLKSFHEQGFSFTNKSIVLFGNGGAARSLLFTLIMEEKPQQIFMVGRNKEKLQVLADECYAKTNFKVHTLLYQDYSTIQKEVDILVNTTSLGMESQIDKSPLSSDQMEPHQIAYDIVYNPEETVFLKNARSKGLKTLGGLGMLVYQGIASFKHWIGEPPPAEVYFNALRKVLKK